MQDLILFSNSIYNGIICDYYRDKNGDIYMTGEQIGQCLEYSEPLRSISNIYNKYKKRLKQYSTLTRMMTVDGKNRTVRLFNENGIYLVIKCSSQPKAMDFYEKVANVMVKLRKELMRRALERGRTKYTRRELTDVLRDTLPDSPHKQFMYKHYTDLAYKAAIGCTAKQFKKWHGLSKETTIKDFLTVEELEQVSKAEDLIRVFVRLGYDYEYIKAEVVKNFQVQGTFSSKLACTQALANFDIKKDATT